MAEGASLVAKERRPLWWLQSEGGPRGNIVGA